MSAGVTIFFNDNTQTLCENQDELWNAAEAEILANKKQRHIISEIYSSEIAYLYQLNILIKFFLQPLELNVALNKCNFNVIFNNILQLYEINKELLQAIRNNPFDIASAFITFAPYLKLYSIYACGYKKALATLEEIKRQDKQLLNFIKGQETRPEVGATLISLLIAPIQRVPRYRLLLQSLLEAYPSTHDHYSRIQDALVRVEDTAEHINRLISEVEGGEELVLLARRLGRKGAQFVTPARRIIRQGPIRKSSNGLGSCQRYLVLFNDSLLVCKGSNKGLKGSLKVSRLLPLRHAAVNPALGSAMFKVVCRNVDMLFYTNTPQDGEEWIAAIKDAVANHVKCRRTLRKESSKRSLASAQRRLSAMRRTTSTLLQRARRVCRVGARKSGLAKLKRLRRLRQRKVRSPN